MQNSYIMNFITVQNKSKVTGNPLPADKHTFDNYAFFFT